MDCTTVSDTSVQVGALGHLQVQGSQRQDRGRGPEELLREVAERPPPVLAVLGVQVRHGDRGGPAPLGGHRQQEGVWLHRVRRVRGGAGGNLAPCHHTFRIHSNVAINWEAKLLPGGQRDRILRIFIN